MEMIQKTESSRIIYQLNVQKNTDFEEIAVYFSKDEWSCLKEEEQQLYKDVMMENYQNLRSVGCIAVKPTVVSKIERGEDPYVSEHQQIKKAITLNAVIDCDITSNIPDGNNIFHSVPSSKVKHFHGNNYLGPNYIDINVPVKHLKESSLVATKDLNSCEENIKELHIYKHGENPGTVYASSPVEKYSQENTLTQKFHNNLSVLSCNIGNSVENTNGKTSYTSGTTRSLNKVEKTITCLECGKCFTHRSSLRNHRVVHTGEKPFSCSECGKYFNRKSSLTAHMRIHTGEKTFPCPECGKCFRQTSDFIRHQRIHTGEKPYACSECGKCFNRETNLYTHMRVHAEKKPFACSECEKCFINHSSLVIHIRTHTGEKPFVCSECGKCFKQASDIIRHQRIHTGEKPFICSECGECFKRRDSLNLHLRLHTGENPFVCSECGKSCISNAQLVEHKRSHTGEKTFACSECGKCFIRKSYLVKHQRIHIGKTICNFRNARSVLD